MISRRTYLIIALALAVLTAGASAGWYPQDKLPVPQIDSDVPGAYNDIGRVVVQLIGNAAVGPEAADADQLLNDAHMNQTTNINATNFLGGLDYPRSVTVTTNASTSGAFKITGTDITGAAIYENISLSGASTGSTARAFKTVTRIQVDLTTGQTNKTVDVGVGDVLGLNNKLATNTVLLAALDGTREGTAPTVAVNSSVISLNTADLSSACNGKPVKLWYIV